MSEQAQIDGFHQRAAESYLQGQFAAALASWRELLKLDPQDERAIEGIRLCELIVQQAEESAFDEPDLSPPDSAPMDRTPLRPGEASDVDFDEIESIFRSSEPSPGAEAHEEPDWDLSALPDADPIAGLDLADLPDLASDSPGAGAGSDFDFPGLDLGTSGAPEAHGPAGDAEDEVESRVAELLSQASTSYDAGDVEGAMTLLERVFILDEENAAAAALARAFQVDNETRNQPSAGDGPVPDAVADDSLQSLGLADTSDSGAGALDGPDASPLVATPPEIGTPDGALDALDAPGAEPDAVAAKPRSPRASLPLSRKQLLVGLGVVLSLAGAGFVGLRISRSGAEVPPAVPVAEASPRDVVASGPGTAAPAPDLAVDPNAAARAPEPVEDLTSIKARAAAAFKAGDFSSAVVAYNEALQVAPDDRDAKRGLAAAGAAYQEQREFMKQLDEATDAYANGEYRKALRMFYRLPGTEGVTRFDRFKANGWYSLGVTALKTGACNDAKSHLAEAATLLPAESAVTHAVGLARGCSTGQSDPVWQSDVQRLEVRRLDD